MHVRRVRSIAVHHALPRRGRTRRPDTRRHRTVPLLLQDSEGVASAPLTDAAVGGIPRDAGLAGGVCVVEV